MKKEVADRLEISSFFRKPGSEFFLLKKRLDLSDGFMGKIATC